MTTDEERSAPVATGFYDELRKSVQLGMKSPVAPYPAAHPVPAAGMGDPEIASVSELIVADLRSAVGNAPAQWLVAIWVFAIVVWVRLQLGQVDSGSYPPAVLTHLFEGAGLGAPAAVGAKKAVNRFAQGAGGTSRRQSH